MLRMLSTAALRREPVLARLGPDILAEDFEPEPIVRLLRDAPECSIGDALLDQRLLAGIGNIFKSEACFTARLDPWQPIAELSDEQLHNVIHSAHDLMQRAVDEGRQDRAVYRRRDQPCPRCATPIRSRGQGDANRTTYWCPTGQLPR